MTHPTPDPLRAALEWYADQFCELGSSHECCGRMSDDECSGCRARAALAAAPQPAPEEGLGGAQDGAMLGVIAARRAQA